MQHDRAKSFTSQNGLDCFCLRKELERLPFGKASAQMLLKAKTALGMIFEKE